MLAKVANPGRIFPRKKPGFMSGQKRIFFRRKLELPPKENKFLSGRKAGQAGKGQNNHSKWRKTREETNCCEKKRNFAFKI